MIELTQTARERFDIYLARLRSALKGARHVEPAEVEQNVREHVEVALAGVPGPISAERLGTVLDKLGPPERWIAEEERPAWKQALDRLRTGPEDWRLAYIAFGLFVLMFVLAPIGGMLLLIPGYVVSRAAVSLLAEKGDAMGARRWLILPSIVMVLVLVGMIILFAVPAGLVAFAIEEHGLYRMTGLTRHFLPLSERVMLETGVVMVAFGGWWMIAASILTPLYRPLQVVFAPTLDSWRRRHLAVLALVGAIIAAIGAVMLMLRL